MRAHILLVAAAIALSSSVSAATSFGYGNRTCEEFTAASRGTASGKFKMRDISSAEFTSANAAYMQWAQGFVSGIRFNQANGLSKRISGVAFDDALRSYCAAHPAERFGNAVEDLARREGLFAK